MLVMLRAHAVFSVSLSRERGEALPIVAGEIFVHRIEFGFVFLAQLLKVRERRPEYLAPGGLLLEIGAGLTGKTESADQRRKRQALEDQRDENHGEREKNNQIALLERGAIGDRLRQRDGSREGDYAAHT